MRIIFPFSAEYLQNYLLKISFIRRNTLRVSQRVLRKLKVIPRRQVRLHGTGSFTYLIVVYMKYLYPRGFEKNPSTLSESRYISV